MRSTKGYLKLGVLLAAAGLSGIAQAFTIGDFTTVTDPSEALFFEFCVINPANSPSGDLANLDFGLAVTSTGSQVFFEFVNVSSIPSVITAIYFDDGTRKPSGPSSTPWPAPNYITNGAVHDSSTTGNGVGFTIGTTSQNLPGGSNLTPAFQARESLTAFANDPKPTWGVDSTPVHEFLVLRYDSVVSPAAVATALLNGNLRVGMHVQSINGGPSDGFIAKPFTFPPDPNPQDPVPEPSTLILLGMGSSFLITRLRREI